MRDVSFRFKDMKTSFFKEIMGNKAPQIHELTINYRSHSGVLNLAQCVLRILEKNYPHAIDRVPSDSGMFPGPTPKFIKPCDPDFLKLMIAANTRDPISEIGVLGSHQAVIVRTEKSKDETPFDKDEDLMFTIYEAKGLEYDDVLLYNFFSGCAKVRS
jgi:ATP-dependent exoDNAse (exonuclease V) beta subunit